MNQSMIKWKFIVLCIVSMICFVAAEDLYEILGVRGSATSKDIKKIYRKLALKYHPDKQTEETKAKMEAEFVKIANAYRILSDPARREKYDLYGIVDEGEFKNFNDAFGDSQKAIEDTPMNWFFLILVVFMTALPFFLMSSKKKKPVNRQRKVLKEKMANKENKSSLRKRDVKKEDGEKEDGENDDGENDDGEDEAEEDIDNQRKL